MQQLVLVTIGPVQDLIASARRSRDLWFGSWLLSQLARAAAEALLREAGASLIFPAESAIRPAERPASAVDVTAELSVANRIIGTLPADADAPAAANRIEAAVRHRLSEIRDRAFSGVGWTGDGASGGRDAAAYRALAEAQVSDLPECYWAAAAVPDDPDGYPAALAQLEALLAARKATRTFPPAGWAAPLPKSSLDGLRESVIPESLYPDRPGPRHARTAERAAARQRLIDQLFRRYQAGPLERLSGVDLLKRFGNRAAGPADVATAFPTTHHLAALPFIAGLSAAELARLRESFAAYLVRLQEPDIGLTESTRLPDRYRASCPLGNVDLALLYDSTLAEHLEGEPLERAGHSLQRCYAVSTGGRRPGSYFAILQADGDGMGQVIAAQRSPDAHQQLSRTLAEFAASVAATVERDYAGALIYAGGDDVLALLPLHRALDCAAKLAQDFRRRTTGYIDADGRAPTLSVGVVVHHAIDALADGLALVHQAERAAKAVPGKNGLAITVSKRSGGDRTIGGSWHKGFFKRLTDLIDLHRQAAVPDGAAFELQALAERLRRPGRGDDWVIPPEALTAEALRILKRKRRDAGTRAMADDDLNLITRWLKPDGVTVAALADELIVAREFARADKAVTTGVADADVGD